MSEEWSLRDEIYHTAHRWPVLSLFCLIGVLAGWMVSYLLPTPYRATKELYVGLSIYRAAEDRNNPRFAGITFNNADDYKNWQMANLNTLVLMDAIVDQTLAVLRENDPYWQEISRKQLAEMLHVYWRNAGKWRLVAENRDAERARQMVMVWEDTAVPIINLAISQAQSVMVLDIQMQELAAKQTSLMEQRAEKETIQQELKNAESLLSALPSDQILNENDRWQIWLPVSQVVSSPEWLEIVEDFPVELGPVKAYRSGVEKALAVIDMELRTLDGQILQLNEETSKLTAAYIQASGQSMGFSPNLKVDRITEEAPLITQVRPTGNLVLVGGSLGFMLWLLFSFVRISMKARS